MKEVVCYEDDAGVLHRTLVEAEQANCIYKATKEFVNSDVYYHCALQVSNFNEFREWFNKNHDWLCPALGVSYE